MSKQAFLFRSTVRRTTRRLDESHRKKISSEHHIPNMRGPFQCEQNFFNSIPPPRKSEQFFRFQKRNDVECYKANGFPVLRKTAFPNRNLTLGEIMLQTKLNDTVGYTNIKKPVTSAENPVTVASAPKLVMKCAVTGCHNAKPNKEKHFFFCPRAHAERQLWMNVTGKVYGSKSKFIICENHFDVSFPPIQNMYF